MTTICPSRVAVSPGATLDNVIVAIRRADLPDRRRHEMISAVQTVVKVLNRPINEIPLDPRLLANRLAEVAPAAAGLSPGRWANVKSLLRAALSLVREIGPGRHLSPLSPEWRALWELQPNPTAKTRLSRFMHFASAAGIGPNEITIQTFEAFRSYLDSSLLKDPDRVYCATVDGWRAARRFVVGWPDVEVERPNRHNLWALPWSAFPTSLRQDIDAWLERLSGDDLMVDGPARPIRPITRKSHSSQLRRFASGLVLSGRSPDTLRSLADLIAIDAFVSGLNFLRRDRANKPSGVRNTASILKAVARHHVGVDPPYLDEMTQIIRRIGPAQRGLTSKNRERLRPLDDPQNVRALLGLPEKLKELALREHRPHKAAHLAETAVAIEILEMTLMRMRNLVGLDIARHLKRVGRTGALWIVIEGDETKNGQPLEFPLHPRSAALVELFLEKFRPVLSRGHGSALFPGKGGRPKHPNSLAEQIKRAVWTHTGLAWNPHLFRHAGVKLHLDVNPGRYGLPRRVLGHRSDTTLTSHYAGAEGAAAVRHFDQIMMKLRDGAVPPEGGS